MAARTTGGANETVAAASSTGSATLVASLAEPARLRGLLVQSSTAAGSVVVRDGGSGGTARLTVHTPPSADWKYVAIPGGGIVFNTDVYAALTNAVGVTAFYST